VADGLNNSADSVDKAIAEIIRRQLTDEVAHTRCLHDVYWLTPPDDPRAVRLPQVLSYTGAGAFTMGQRYVAVERLKVANTCADAST
jgi:hypothetical protein